MNPLQALSNERALWRLALSSQPTRARLTSFTLLALLFSLPGAAFAQSPDVGEMFANFSSSTIAIFNLVMKGGMFIGLLVTIKAVLSFKEYSESGGRTQLKTPVTLLFVGIFLFSLPTTMNVATQSLALGAFSGTNVMSEGIPDGGMPGASAAIKGVLLFVKLIGLIAAVRGFLIFKKLGEGGGQAGAGVGLTHVLGGAMAVNIETTYNMLKNSVGF